MEEAPTERVDRGPRIPPTKVKDIKPTPSISIFYKVDKNSPVQCIDSRFPRDAAMIFCDRMRHELMDNNSKSFTVTGGDITGLKDVLAWIQDCVLAGEVAKFKDVSRTSSPFCLQDLSEILHDLCADNLSLRSTLNNQSSSPPSPTPSFPRHTSASLPVISPKASQSG